MFTSLTFLREHQEAYLTKGPVFSVIELKKGFKLNSKDNQMWEIWKLFDEEK